MKVVAIITLTIVIFQAVFAAAAVRSEELESSLSNYLQSAAASAAAQSAAALSVAAAESAAAASSLQNFPATKLESSVHSESSGCRSFANCQNGAGEGTSVKDVVQPIEDWIKDFKTRTSGSNSNDLMASAKTVIHPLIKKLKRSQREALEKLEESDAEIVRHVEEQATEHVYNLLRAENISAKKQDAATERKEKIAEVKAEAAEKEKEARAVAEHSESSKKK